MTNLVAVISIDNPWPEPPINVYAQTLNRVVTCDVGLVWQIYLEQDLRLADSECAC